MSKITGERKQISKNEFDKERHCALGNKKFLFLCRNILTNKEKLINLYEWPVVKDQYEIIDINRFNIAKNLNN